MTTGHKRLAANTSFLYLRMLLVIGVSLYTVRIVLNTLGAHDYGIYSAVAGMVALCSFLPSSMASATQRFFSVALGQNDTKKLSTTFTVNIILYATLAIIAGTILSTAGLWFVNNHLNIPPDRFDAAIRIYYFSILTLVVSIFTSPFMAIIIAHEDMQIYAYTAISDAFMKLLSAYLLTHIPHDKLELYGLMLLLTAAINAALYISICLYRYKECQFRKFYWDGEMLRAIVSFTSWTLFGQLSTTARNQAVTILLNQAFNPVVVAARAIAVNVLAHVTQLSNNLNTSLYAPIMKSWASGDKRGMQELVFVGSRMTFFLMWIITLPLALEMTAVLTIWLKEFPSNTILFIRLALVEALIMAVSLPLATAARAQGKIARYEFTLGIMQFCIFALSWPALKLGAPAWSVYAIAIGMNLMMFFVRLGIVRDLIGFPAKLYIQQVLYPVFKVVALSLVPSILVSRSLSSDVVHASLSAAVSTSLAVGCTYFFGIGTDMRHKIQIAFMSRWPR